MSMNKYMHPLNIYKTPPNFKQLAIQFPEFRKHVKQDITGKVTLDFKDANALRVLSCTLLKKDFGLDVEIPSGKMVPTIPLRLNYLLWLNDLLHLFNKKEIVKGIDIGTGASCVYPLIGSKKFGWKMVGTEIDSESFKCAMENVIKNSLENDIKLLQVSGDTLLEEVFRSVPEEEYDFCMCNPPFFSSTQELHPFFKARTAGRTYPRNAFVASVNEVVADGGEVKFVTKLINESKALKTKIRIYSTMLGHKSSLPLLKKLLREAEVFSFKESEFCQGHTTRWGLAWTFHDVDLRKIPPSVAEYAKKNKPKPPLRYIVPKTPEGARDLEIVTKSLLKLFDTLKIHYDLVKKTKSYTSYNVSAYSDTWSHQRRKRREQKRLAEILSKPIDSVSSDSAISETMSSISSSNHSPMSDEVSSDAHNSSTDSMEIVNNNTFSENTSDSLEEMTNMQSPSAKREHEDDETSESSVGSMSLKKMKIEEHDGFYLKALVIIRNEGGDIVIEVASLEDTDRERLHQIVQYIKNNLKL